MGKNEIKELLAKQNNCRNFSTLTTVSGKKVRPDIIRSNIITRVEQISALIEQDPKTIIDLRIRKEGGGEKNTVFPSATVISLPILFGNLDPDQIGQWLMEGKDEQINSFLEGGYHDFTSSFKAEIKRFFSILLDRGNLPIVFHCSAGKDRTGSLSALFLLALGLSKEDVIKDYMETNNYISIEETLKKITEQLDEVTRSNLPNPEKSINALKMLFGVKKCWIEMFLKGIEDNYGTVEHYLRKELQVDTSELKEIYLNQS